jgi:hypothetical protein
LFFIIFNLNFPTNATYQSLVLTALIVYFITNLKFLLFLGESERYITHTVIFFLLMFINLSTGEEIIYILLYSFIFFTFEFYFFNFIKFQQKRFLDDAIVENFLNKLSSSTLVASIPIHHFSIYRAMLKTPVKCLAPLHLSNNQKLRTNFFKKYLIGDYSNLNLNLIEEIINLTNLDIIIIDKLALKKNNYQYFKKPKNWFEVKLNQNSYLVLKKKSN